MHMQLLKNERVIIFDCTDFGMSNLSLPNGQCHNDPTETTLKIDYTAHSTKYDVTTNTFRPLFIQTNVWCSSSVVMSDGCLIQTGGFNNGEQRVRTFTPCAAYDWQEIENGLAVRPRDLQQQQRDVAHTTQNGGVRVHHLDVEQAMARWVNQTIKNQFWCILETVRLCPRAYVQLVGRHFSQKLLTRFYGFHAI